MTEAWALVEVGVVASQGSLTERGDLTKTRQTQQSPGKYESQYRTAGSAKLKKNKCIFCFVRVYIGRIRPPMGFVPLVPTVLGHFGPFLVILGCMEVPL